ncbi:MAG: YfcE family phosphodiesterase [Brevinematia bacterium]
MSKILVLSDSHGHLGLISDVIKIEVKNIDIVIHLGDAWFDMKPFIKDLKENHKKEVILIRGNIDEMRNDPTTPFIPEKEIITIGNKKVFCTHGHLFNVSKSLEELVSASTSSGANIVLFGHTHTPTVKEINEILFFNPGALRDGFYGIINIAESVSYKHYKLKNLP